MTNEEKRRFLEEIESEKIGELFAENVAEESYYDIGKGLCQLILQADDAALYLIDEFLISTSGYSLESLIKIVKERDSSGHFWACM